jgi:EAL domain-containing protein (putative c-di-GMP-specific phosphodiesterase class I)
MDTDIETREIVRIILMLAHGLDLKVVAEGVETTVQANMLKEMGCELAQGYLYSKPVPSETIEQLLRDAQADRVRANVRAKAATSTST